jgi:hypothetical protein
MLGIFKFFSIITITHSLKLVLGGIIFIMGLINLKDFVVPGKGVSLKVPKSFSPFLEKYARKATISGVIILALVLSVVEVFCTWGIPLVYTTIISERISSVFSAFLYIVWYNLFYVLPLVVVVFLIYGFVLKAEQAEEYKERFKRYMKFIGGLVMVLLGFALWFNIL